MTIQEGTQISGGGELRVCVRCSTPFVFYSGRYKSAAKVCPTCQDRIQGRPSRILERKELNRWEGIEIQSLPGEWQVFDSEFQTDDACYKIDVKGERYGASWSGRIVIYGKEEFKTGDIINIREMEAIHKVKRVSHTTKNIYGDVNTHINDIPLQENHKQSMIDNVYVDDDARSYRHYLVFERSDSPKQCNLHWIKKYSKTTLKGYGRQYKYSIDATTAITCWSIRGGARSGRYYTVGVLAITNQDHPVLTSGSLEASGEDQIIT